MSVDRMKAGVVVRLKSGGSMMTIVKVEDHPEDTAPIYCVWHDKKGRHRWGYFAPCTLVVEVPVKTEDK